MSAVAFLLLFHNLVRFPLCLYSALVSLLDTSPLSTLHFLLEHTFLSHNRTQPFSTSKQLVLYVSRAPHYPHPNIPSFSTSLSLAATNYFPPNFHTTLYIPFAPYFPVHRLPPHPFVASVPAGPQPILKLFH